jgi:chromosome partitioning protein
MDNESEHEDIELSSAVNEKRRRFGGVDLNVLGRRCEVAMNVLRSSNKQLLFPENKVGNPSFPMARLQKWWGTEWHTLIRFIRRDESLPQGEKNGATERGRLFSSEDARLVASKYRAQFMRPPQTDGFTLTVGHFKGGVSKTTTAVSLAQALSLLGHRVLVVDTDPQGSATMMFTGNIEVCETEETLLPLFEGNESTVDYAIRPTAWPAIDIIKASPRLFDAEVALPTRQMRASAGGATQSSFGQMVNLLGSMQNQIPNLEMKNKIAQVLAQAQTDSDGFKSHESGFKFWKVLDEGLVNARKKYDFIVIDTPPSVSYMTLNCYVASQGVIHPLPPHGLDYQSSVEFWALLYRLLGSMAPYDLDLWWQFVIVVRSKVPTGAADDARAYADNLISSSYTDLVSPISFSMSKSNDRASAQLNSVFHLINSSDGKGKGADMLTSAYIELAKSVEASVQAMWHAQDEGTSK